MVLNLPSRVVFAQIIGEAVLILIQSNLRVSIGNILDVLEHKKHSAHDDEIDNLRNAISYLRSRVQNSKIVY